jgi:hypothetical protein
VALRYTFSDRSGPACAHLSGSAPTSLSAMPVHTDADTPKDINTILFGWRH